jgi:hypothetical protein
MGTKGRVFGIYIDIYITTVTSPLIETLIILLVSAIIANSDF